MAFWGRSLRDGGTCDKCHYHRMVIWVHELRAFRCADCLFPKELRPDSPDAEVGIYDAKAALEAMRELEKNLPPRPVEEE